MVQQAEESHQGEEIRRPDGTPTEALVRRAREGDRDALAQLFDRYYERWLRPYHGNLGGAVRKVYDTQDLVQSAVGDILVGLPRLRNDGAFFCWVTAILRHKVARKRRELAREVALAESPEDDPALRWDDAGDEELSRLEIYLETLDAFLELFPSYPERMAVTALKLLDDCTIGEIQERLCQSRRTVYRWLREGTDLLRERLRQ